MSESKRETLEQYIQRRMKEFEESFIIPFEKLFDLRAKFETEWEYQNAKSDHVKTKTDLYNLLEKIDNRLKLQPKTKIGTKDKVHILYVYNTSEEAKADAEVYRNMLGNNVVSSWVNKIETDKYVLEFAGKSDTLRGKRVDKYYNMTGDIEFENAVLKPCLKQYNTPKEFNQSLWHVSIDRGTTKDYTTVTMIDLDDVTKVVTRTYSNFNMEHKVRMLINEMLEHKPSKITFDLRGMGIKFKEMFENLVRQYNSLPQYKDMDIIKIDEKGNVTYSKKN